MEQTVVFAIVLVLVISIAAGLMIYAVPLYAQLRFDHVCRQYTLIAESENGLSTHDIATLTDTLEELGIASVAIQVPKSSVSERGALQTIRIEGHYAYLMPFDRKEKVYELCFETQFLPRKVVN